MKVFGTHDENTLAQLGQVAERARKVALMADGHLGYVMPIGGVAAYDNAGVGRRRRVRHRLRQRRDPHRPDAGGPGRRAGRGPEGARELADEIAETVSFGVGRKNRADDAPTDHPLFEDAAWDAVPAQAPRGACTPRRAQQLGTVGSGNHYVDVFADETGRSGSACISAAAASGTRSPRASWRSARASSGASTRRSRGAARRSTSRWDTTTGTSWSWRAATPTPAASGWPGRWCRSSAARELELVHNHHNFAWKETARGRGAGGGAEGCDAGVSRTSWASSAARWVTMR